MAIPIRLHNQETFSFPQLPEVSLEYQRVRPQHNLSSFPLSGHDLKMRRDWVIYFNPSDIGIPSHVWRRMSDDSGKISQLIEKTAEIYAMFRDVASMTDLPLSAECRRFCERGGAYANFFLSTAMQQGLNYLSGKKMREWVEGAPGMFLHILPSIPRETQIFMRMKGSRFADGGHGLLKKLIWVNTGKIVAVKLLKYPNEGSYPAALGFTREQVWKSLPSFFEAMEDRFDRYAKHFEEEMAVHFHFCLERGIVSPICGGRYGEKLALILPFYKFNLADYSYNHSTELSMQQKIKLTSLYLNGLARIAKKEEEEKEERIHGDLKPCNLVFDIEGDEMTGGIIDFGTCRSVSLSKYGYATPQYAPPEYFSTKRMTPKQDVWSMGLSLHVLFLSKPLPMEKYSESEMETWTASLEKHWIYEQIPFDPQTPIFIKQLIDRMVEPCVDDRFTAKDAWENFTRWEEQGYLDSFKIAVDRNFSI